MPKRSRGVPEGERPSRLRSLGSGGGEGSVRDSPTTTVLLRTGAAWEELMVARTLLEQVASGETGVELAILRGTTDGPLF